MAGRDRATWGTFGFHADQDAWAICYCYDHAKPILVVRGADVDVSLSQVGRDDPVTDMDLRFAELLARAAQTYLSELQRLHAAQSTQQADVA